MRLLWSLALCVFCHKSAVSSNPAPRVGSGFIFRELLPSRSFGNITEVTEDCINANGKKGVCVAYGVCAAEGDQAEDYFRRKGNLCQLSRITGVCCLIKGRSKRQTQSNSLITVEKQRREPDVDGKVDYSGLGDPNRCGFSSKQIIGDQKPNPNFQRDFPWMAAILVKKNYAHFCGGVVLTQRHILTAAHCLPNVKPDKILVRLGEYDFRKATDSNAVDHEVETIITHEDFDTSNFQNDIAILVLKKPCTYDTYVQPICLPSLPKDIDSQFENFTAVAAGWGMTEFAGEMSDVLLTVPVPVWQQKMCVSSFIQTIFNSTLCAAGFKGGKDSCQGDSGGPLMTQRADGRWMTIGVVSWGVGCGDEGKPGVYTRVNNFINWIGAIIS